MKKLKCLITLILILFLSLSNPKHSVAASFQGLGDIPGASFRSYANAVSKDGSIVVGRSSSSSYNQAFIWDRENGIQNIKLVLTNKYQLNLEGWTLINATAISDDGLTIVGWGNNPNGNIEAWIAKLNS